MKQVEIITSSSSRIDLVVGFALRTQRKDAVDSLTLIRRPKYECFLPEEERGVVVSWRSESEEQSAILQEFNYSAAEHMIRLTTTASTYEMDVSKVDESALEQMSKVIARMNADGAFVLTGVEGAEPAPPPQIESTLRSALRAAESARAQDQGQPPDESQKLFYAAMDAVTPEDQVFLLRQSLQKDPENVEALLARLNHEELSLDERVQKLREIVGIAERRLGETTFKEYVGRFWGFVETRPYMRARRYLADTLLELGRLEEAIVEWEGLLQLNPFDNQAVRYSLLPAYLALNRLEDARRLLSTYAEEIRYSTLMAWCRVLERFLAHDLAGASEALAVAREVNRASEAYIKGHRELPKEVPGMYRPHSREEAISFASRLHLAWQAHPAATQWLLKQPKPAR